MSPPTDDRPADVRPASHGVQHWIERPSTVNRIVKALYVCSALTFLADIFAHKHSSFRIEHVFGFYGLYGFIGCVFLVLAAKAMRRVLMRPEDYYDR